MNDSIFITKEQVRAYQILYGTARTLVELAEPAGDETLINTDNLDDLEAACQEVYRVKDLPAVCFKGLAAEEHLLIYKALLSNDGPDIMPDWPKDKQVELTTSLNKLRFDLLGKIIEEGNVAEIKKPMLTCGVDVQKGGVVWPESGSGHE